MTDTIIYFLIGSKEEQAEFSSNDSNEDVKEIFRAAAEAGPYDILKLYNTRGSLINISNRLPQNDPRSRYQLEVVVSHCAGDAKHTFNGFDVSSINKRLERLEHKVYVEKVNDLKNGLPFSRKSELGCPKYPNNSNSTRCSCNVPAHQLEIDRKVYDSFIRSSNSPVIDDIRKCLKQTTFDTWQWDEGEMLILLRQMFIDLDLINKFNIELPVLNEFLYEIYRHYNPVPFHNFKHCFTVTQMMYGLIWMCDLRSNTLDDVDILILITSAICHDVDHPGYNNTYQVNARTPLALRYNDISPLENHHCAVAFDILQQPGCELFKNLSDDVYKTIRSGIIRSILATDMAKHSEILASFNNIIDNFDAGNDEHKTSLMMILIKVADISNEVRPMNVSEPWLECLLQEFFNQSDIEKLEGLPVSPFMDREKVTKPSAQIGFIKFVLLPLFQSLGYLFPIVKETLVKPVKSTLDYYTKMQSDLNEQTLQKSTCGDVNTV